MGGFELGERGRAERWGSETAGCPRVGVKRLLHKLFHIVVLNRLSPVNDTLFIQYLYESHYTLTVYYSRLY